MDKDLFERIAQEAGFGLSLRPPPTIVTNLDGTMRFAQPDEYTVFAAQLMRFADLVAEETDRRLPPEVSSAEDAGKIKRVQLEGDALVFRVFENDLYVDRVFVRDPSKPVNHNCWMRIESYRAFVEKYETPPARTPGCGR